MREDDSKLIRHRFARALKVGSRQRCTQAHSEDRIGSFNEPHRGYVTDMLCFMRLKLDHVAS